jgi:hypothetical protein
MSDNRKWFVVMGIVGVAVVTLGMIFFASDNRVLVTTVAVGSFVMGMAFTSFMWDWFIEDWWRKQQQAEPTPTEDFQKDLLNELERRRQNARRPP